MAYFEDLSDYSYLRSEFRPGPVNVGWLEPGHTFEEMLPDERILDLLWEHCKISVALTRGFHLCELCAPPKQVFASRNRVGARLGTSEIRVFSKTGEIYAAPNLIYHYLRTHHYKPPDGFLRALEEGFVAPNADYFEQLRRLNLEWCATHNPPRDQSGFRSERIGGELRRVEVQIPTYFDD